MSVIPKCEVCGAFLDCRTDWIGRMHFIHDGPCKPITPTWKVPCDVCGKTVVLERPKKDCRELIACCEKCRKELGARRRQQVAEAGKRYRERLRVAPVSYQHLTKTPGSPRRFLQPNMEK